MKKVNIKKCSHYYLQSTVPFSAPPPLFTIILALHIVVTCVLQNHYGIEHDPFLAFGEFPLFYDPQICYYNSLMASGVFIGN